MARARGINSQTLLKFESVYGSAPSGNYAKVPVVSIDYGIDQPLIPDDTLGHGRDKLDPSQDVKTVAHSASIPVDVRSVGHWLKGLFAAPVTTGTGPYVHTFTSGATSLPSAAIEVGLTDVGLYFMKKGVAIDAIEWELQPSGLVTMKVDMIGQNDVKGSSSGGGTPTEAVYTRFNQFQGAVTKDGSAFGSITDLKFKYMNHLDPARVIRGDGLIDGVDPAEADLTGSVTIRITDATFFDAGAAKTALAMGWSWTIDADTSLTFDAPRVFVPQAKKSVNGPGGLSATFDFQASKDPTAEYMLQAVLKNDVASY